MIFTFGSIQKVGQPVRCARCSRWHRGGLGFRSSLFTLKSMAHRCQTALELEICPKNLRDLSIVKSAGRQTGRFQQPWACREGPRYSTLLLRPLMGELRHASGRGTRWRIVFSNLFPYWKKPRRGVKLTKATLRPLATLNMEDSVF